MVARKAREQKHNSMWINVVYGLGVSISITILGCMLGAIMLNREMIDSFTTIMSMITWIASSFCGTSITARQSRGNKLLVLSITAAVYLFVLVGISILFFDDSFHTLWQGITGILIGAGITVLTFGKNRTKHNNIKYRK